MKLAALLLAGGQSRRMGWPKALVDFRGRPLWRHQLETLRTLAPDEVFISAPPGLELADASETILRDEKSNLGPLAGLHAACTAMKSDWLLVLAIDMPAMTSAYLIELRETAGKSSHGQVPQMDGYFIGLAAIYPRAALAGAGAQLREEDRSLQRLVREGIAKNLLAARIVTPPERALFLNMNDPATAAVAG